MKIDAKLFLFAILAVAVILALTALMVMADRIEAQMKDDVRAAGEAVEVYKAGGGG